MGAGIVRTVIATAVALSALGGHTATAAQTGRDADLAVLGTANQLVIEAGLNDDGGRDYYAEFNFGLPDLRLFVSAAHTRNELEELAVGPVVLEATNITTDYFAAGVSSDPFAPMTVAADASYWGDEDAITTQTARVQLGFNTRAWNLQLAPQFRTIAVHTLIDRTRTLETNGFSLSATYFGLGSLSVTAGYNKNYYDQNLSVVASLRALLLVLRGTLSRQTLELAAGLEDERLSAAAYYALPGALIGVDWFQSVSAVDESRINVVTMNAFWDVSAQWQLRLKAGQQHSSTGEPPLIFASTGFAFRW